ncbi:MAG: tRNA uridine-5-carboxymethylaminomethyl(34) synthesis GTPase MnmE [Planctomycetes bacterium]|nr:tRNA uridine-5-carboxymethylaminomethyl(34) synthesis GTPase MnmE [Planctomycetota bacterium]
MYQLNDTIAAVSSPTLGQRAIVRVTGPKTIEKVSRIFSPPITKAKPGIISGIVTVDDELKIDAKLYLFLAPHSYTGETLAEIHIHTSPAVTQTLVSNLLTDGSRTAEPGEFTARAYLNGKIDLAQAEAVAEIVASSNKFQLAAAEKLLSGRLSETTNQVSSALMDCLSLIEAGLDFSGEDIEFITGAEAIQRLEQIKQQLQQLLSGSISYEAVIDLPAVGIAGAPNAGKSSLLNKLLKEQRSIVSEERKTTRDVLAGELSMKHCKVVLFDCAGLILITENILDELAQQAATEALQNSTVVLFCLDASKTDYTEDIAIRKLIDNKEMILVVTKTDLLTEKALTERLAELKKLFPADILATSAKTGTGIEQLRETIDKKVMSMSLAPSALPSSQISPDGLGLTTVRHERAVTEAVEHISESISELKSDNEEVAAMMLRAAHQAISSIEQESIDEQILANIFQRFCIGK